MIPRASLVPGVSKAVVVRLGDRIALRFGKVWNLSNWRGYCDFKISQGDRWILLSNRGSTGGASGAALQNISRRYVIPLTHDFASTPYISAGATGPLPAAPLTRQSEITSRASLGCSQFTRVHARALGSARTRSTFG